MKLYDVNDQNQITLAALLCVGYDIYHPATQTSQNARELSDENLIWFYPTFLVVKASWKHIDILITQNICAIYYKRTFPDRIT